MGQQIVSIIFRRLTYADFRHINKVGGEEVGGGGQSYIDFPVKDISLNDWFKFLGDETGYGAGNRPIWEFQMNSLGLNLSKKVKIYQRRAASVSIASQKIHSKEANRVPAWHPDNDFPTLYDTNNLGNLVIYIAKTIEGEFWAGWFLKKDIPINWSINEGLKQLFLIDSAGSIEFKSGVFIDTQNNEWPFYFGESLTKTQEDIEEDLVKEDTSINLESLIGNTTLKPEVKERILKIRQRNNQIVKTLKKLYKGHCQLTGEKFTFKKRDGELYSEVHHLIALGENGSDSYANAIVVSPLIHRMLHYAEVSPIDLTKIKNNQLPITINGNDYKITWHPKHLEVVEKSLAD